MTAGNDEPSYVSEFKNAIKNAHTQRIKCNEFEIIEFFILSKRKF